jgi:hypothetical protein
VFAKRYTAFIDACVLVGVLKRNILLSLAEAEFFRIAWSNEVLQETERAIGRLLRLRGRDHPDLVAAEQIYRMKQAFPEACIYDYELLVGIVIPDIGDLHVLGAAVKAQASTIVTDNIKDFPSKILDRLNIEVKTADEFIADTVSLDIEQAVSILRAMRLRFRHPSLSAAILLDKMKVAQLKKTALILGDHVEML